VTIDNVLPALNIARQGTAAVMSTIPTATGIGSKDGPYSSMIELLKIQIRFLEVAKEGKIDADTYAAYVGGLPLPALVGATAVDPHPDACRARQVDAECASSATAQSQPFDEWLKEVRMFLCQQNMQIAQPTKVAYYIAE